MGQLGPDGYSVMHWTGKPHRKVRVHRVTYALANGVLFEALDSTIAIRHSCDTRACINPDHLSPGTWADNVRDSVKRHRHAVAFEEVAGVVVGLCVNGHDLATVGVYDHGIQKTGYRLRQCLACKRARGRAYQRRVFVSMVDRGYCSKGHVLCFAGTIGKNNRCFMCFLEKCA